MKIGVIGFSATHFNQEAAKVILRNRMQEIISGLDKKEIEIVSGYTNTGIPRIAYEFADYLGLKTVGFSAKKAFKVSCELYPVDKGIIFGEDFGDESQEFVNYINILIRIGGGLQSRKEVELFRDKNIGRDISQLLFEEEIDCY